MNIRFILVEPKVPENVGSAARAIKVTGAGTLALVNPLCRLDEKALWVAHGSEEILSGAMIYDSLAAALAGTSLSVATTAKSRRVTCEPLSLSETLNYIEAMQHGAGDVAVVFGREESGLTNEEIKLCDISSYIPMQQPFPSFNLAQAVLLYAHSLSGLSRQFPPGSPARQEHENTTAPLHQLRGQVSVVLGMAGIPADRAITGRILERLAHLSPADQRLMMSAATKIRERIEEDIKPEKPNK